MLPFDRQWSLSDAVQLACLYEATAPKVGNVHPGASFDDMHFGHFAASGVAIREVFAFDRDSQSHSSLGEIVLSAVNATRKQVGCNTNLGTLLLFAPIALAHRKAEGSVRELRVRISAVLESLTSRDSHLVYEAIRVAAPGGLGKREKDDVAASAPSDLIQAMRQVAAQDAVARQYASGYADIFERLLPWFAEEQRRAVDPLDAICRLQIRWLAYENDGLIIRKLGADAASVVREKARAAWQALSTQSDQPTSELEAVVELDRYLRSDGNRLNPGTTADLIAATLLVSLLTG